MRRDVWAAARALFQSGYVQETYLKGPRPIFVS
jgi:hypothetical protein